MSGPGALQTLLLPRGIAVVGASDNPEKVGGRPIHHLKSHGFQGALYPVTSRASVVQGLTAYPSLESLPEIPDVAILSVPAARAHAEIESCARLGIPNVLLFSSGFAETGAKGQAAQDDLAHLCRAHGIRLLGPNTLGVANFANGAVLSFASVYLDVIAEDGPLAVVSQSGAFGVAAYSLLRENGIGVRYVCTTGNQADLEVADFIDALSSDSSIRVMLLYLEEARDMEVLRRALQKARSNRIAILAVLAGASAHGARSARLHTGSKGFPGADAGAIGALFRGLGCRLATSLPELCESVPLYLCEARPDAVAGGLALISNSGASCVIAADAAAEFGLPLAELSGPVQSALAAVLPEFSLNRNPLDLTAMLLADPGLLGNVVDLALSDPQVRAAALGLIATGGPNYDLARFVRDTAKAVQESAKPCAIHAPDQKVRQAFGRAGFPVYPSEHAAIKALSAWQEHLIAMQGAAGDASADAIGTASARAEASLGGLGRA